MPNKKGRIIQRKVECVQIENLVDLYPDKIIAYCTGNRIDKDFKCNQISVDEKVFDVIKYDVLTSLSGNYAASV